MSAAKEVRDRAIKFLRSVGIESDGVQDFTVDHTGMIATSELRKDPDGKLFAYSITYEAHEVWD